MGRLVRLGCGFLMLALLGCGGKVMVPVSGAVSFNGTPVEEGEIVFQPEDASEAPDAGAIKNGEFAFKANVGARKVQIRGLKTIKVMEMGPVKENYIPEKFNAKTTLTETITAQGPNRFTFDLKSP